MMRDRLLFGAALCLLLDSRHIVRVVAPGTSFNGQAAVPIAAAALLVAAGAWGTWRRGRVRSGAALAASTGAIGAAAAILFWLARAAAAGQDPVAAIRADDEIIGLPAMLFAFAVALGTVGALAAIGLRRIVRRPDSV